MAEQNSNAPSRPSVSPALIQSPAANLFRSGYDDLNGETDLPFTPDTLSHRAESSLWNEPDFGNDVDKHVRADEFGKRAAAAYFLHLQSGGLRISLHSLMSDMFSSSENTTARMEFCAYLHRLLWLYGQSLSPAQVAADVEAVLLEDAKRRKEDSIYMEQKAMEQLAMVPKAN